MLYSMLTNDTNITMITLETMNSCNDSLVYYYIRILLPCVEFHDFCVGKMCHVCK